MWGMLRPLHKPCRSSGHFHLGTAEPQMQNGARKKRPPQPKRRGEKMRYEVCATEKFTEGILCSSSSGLLCFLVRGSKILPKAELHTRFLVRYTLEVRCWCDGCC